MSNGNVGELSVLQMESVIVELKVWWYVGQDVRLTVSRSWLCTYCLWESHSHLCASTK